MKYVKHKDIDKDKWNKLVLSLQGTPFYFLFDYLTSICQWDAVIIEKNSKYALVLPLPFKKKLWFKYIYQPFFCQQLGTLSSSEITKELALEIHAILKKEFNFGYAQWLSNDIVNEVFKTDTRINYEINLSLDYENLKLNFNKNRRRILNTLTKRNYEIKSNNSVNDINDCIDRFGILMAKTIPEIQPSHYSTLKQALSKISDNAEINVVSVLNGDNIISSGLFIGCNKRIVYLLGFTEADFRKDSVQTLLFNHLIQKNSSSKTILDLEGGSSEGIGRFYKSLGGSLCHYHKMFLNPNHLIFRKIFG